MYFLSLETSTKIFSLAINKDEKVLRYRNLKSSLVLEDTILPAIERMLDAAEIEFSQIDAFAIARGPGSFTSLRVGLSIVKAFAMGTSKPVVGIPSLDIIARGAENNSQGPYDEICVINDARRGQVYACIYRAGHKETDYLLAPLDDVLDKVHGTTLFVGDALKDHQKAIENIYREYAFKKNNTCKCLFAEEKYWYPQARVMAAISYERLSNKQYDDAANLLPLYLYAQDCQVSSLPESKKQSNNNGR